MKAPPVTVTTVFEASFVPKRFRSIESIRKAEKQAIDSGHTYLLWTMTPRGMMFTITAAGVSDLPSALLHMGCRMASAGQSAIKHIIVADAPSHDLVLASLQLSHLTSAVH